MKIETLRWDNDRLEMTVIRLRIMGNNVSYSLFYIAGFCRNLGTAYIAMWRQYQL